MRLLEFELYGSNISMFTLGGGGVRCMCQALCRKTHDHLSSLPRLRKIGQLCPSSSRYSGILQ